MKKLMALALSAAALSALADVPGNEVGLIQINSSLKDTVVAVPFTSLSGGNVKVSELVKTTNLTAGDSLWVFENDKYTAWTLSGGEWTSVPTVNAGGLPIASGSTPSAGEKALNLGSAIWIRRQDPSKPFWVYGAYTDNVSTVVQANKWNLVANPRSTDSRLPPPFAKGDVVRIPSDSGFPRTYKAVMKDSTLTWQSGKDSYESPVLKPGEGVWYISNGGAGTINW